MYRLKRHQCKERYIWRDNITRNQLVCLQDCRSLSNAEPQIYAATDGTKVIAHLKVLLSNLRSRDNSLVTTYQSSLHYGISTAESSQRQALCHTTELFKQPVTHTNVHSIHILTKLTLTFPKHYVKHSGGELEIIFERDYCCA